MKSSFLVALLMTVGSGAISASATEKDSAFKKLNLTALHEEAPDLLFLANGKKTELKNYFGKPIILHIWATWCASCAKEIPGLKKLEKAGSKMQISFLPIAVDEEKNAAQVTEFLDKLPPPAKPIQSFIALPGDALKKYQTWGIPVTYFIDSKGQVIARALGMREWSSVSDLDALLAEIFKVQN